MPVADIAHSIAEPAIGEPPSVVTPAFFTPAEVPPGPPRLFVVVDTEEAFDWSAPFSRDAVDVTAIDDVHRLQAVVEPLQIVPTYVVDYPVASTQRSAETLVEIVHRGACQVGAHLHPWVNPPHTEIVTARNSFACNLGETLETQKIARLRDLITERFDVAPRAYKAGRYGFGSTTAAALEALGFDVDLSVNPHWDFTGDGGPSFQGIGPRPSTFGLRRRLLEVPCTTGFIGAMRHVGPAVHRAASVRWLEPLRSLGVLARSGALNRVMLSPEVSTFEEMQALTEALLADGVRTFSLTFHSPSLRPGCTPYVRTASERDALVATIDRYCDDFLGRLGGVPGTPVGLFDELGHAA